MTADRGTSDKGKVPALEQALETLENARAGIAGVQLPLALPDAEEARRAVTEILAQLDDYVIPRYRSLDAPLLAVVGGSTGAGKSTLVNALAGFPVTRAGAIRPTTRQPILLHHPLDAEWFEGKRILPNLDRIRGSAAAVPSTAGDQPVHPAGSPAVSSLVLVAHEHIPQGIALLDAPDIDSISDDNRRLAGQLLAAADLWVFVTTANRYADAVPWRLLLDAAARDITVAVVLDRVPPAAEVEVREDLRDMLERQGLAGARLFVVQETALDNRGMLPAGAADELAEWLGALAANAAERSSVARRTLHGAIKSAAVRLESVATAASAQEAAAQGLHNTAVEEYAEALRRIIDATKDGALLRGEVLARWQDFVGTGEFFRALEQNVGRLRDRLGAYFRGEPAPAVKVETAIESGLQAVILDQAANAAENVERRWRSDPAGRQLLGDEIPGASPGFDARAAAAIRQWQEGLMELIRTQGQGKRTQARWLSFGVNGLGAALMVVVFSMTAGLSGLEIGIAGGTAVVGQRLLEAVFGEDAVRRLANQARQDLQARCQQLLDVERERFLGRLDTARPTGAAYLMDHSRELRRLAGEA
ncbi:dynamin family protein [Paenarthrobacter sp. NPDC089675]|uniref:dynamin family protein n=1 Tax=Paenarthrobacter sp. NPDC089675 TaxID=3364376 RepID=UPI003829869E